MHFFLEKFVYPVLVAIALAVIAANAFDLDWPKRIAVAIVLVLVALLVGHAITRKSATQRRPARRHRWFPLGRVPLGDAARLMHEAMEKEGIAADIAGQSYSSPSVHLSHSKHVFMAAAKEGRIRLFGKRLPSTQSLEIPADKMSQLRPVDLEPDSLWSMSRSLPRDYYDVQISRWDLNKAIRYRIRLVKRVDEGLRREIKSP
jgi:hypothetical protein